MKKQNILKKIDKMSSFTEKLEFLNAQFLRAKTAEQEDMILEMINQLKFFGK